MIVLITLAMNSFEVGSGKMSRVSFACNPKSDVCFRLHTGIATGNLRPLAWCLQLRAARQPRSRASCNITDMSLSSSNEHMQSILRSKSTYLRHLSIIVRQSLCTHPLYPGRASKHLASVKSGIIESTLKAFHRTLAWRLFPTLGR